MPRKEVESFKQDRLGNSRRELDTLRAQEGMSGFNDDEGIVQIQSADTGSDLLILSKPTHAQDMFITQLHAFNSNPTAGDTFSVFEADLDGSGSITSTTRRSVPHQVDSATTAYIDYEGESFEKAISITAEFEGQVGVAVVSDHHEENEPASEITESP